MKNNNLYNDKEIDDEADLNWLDYGFRNYDAQIGRFVQLDPLTDETPALSGYHYALNDPITNIDQDGLMGIPCPGASLLSVFAERTAEALGAISNITSIASISANLIKIGGDVGQQKSTANQIGNTLNGKNVQQVGDPGAQRRGLDGVNTKGISQSDVETRLRLAEEKKFLELRKKSWRHTYANHWVNTLTGEENIKSEALGDELVGQAAMMYVLGRIPIHKFLSGIVSKGVSVIGPRATYREFAKQIGANFLDVTDEIGTINGWSYRKNVEFLQGVVKRGDDVLFAGKFNPAKLDPKSILAQEIRYLQKRGYKWSEDFSRMIKK